MKKPEEFISISKLSFKSKTLQIEIIKEWIKAVQIDAIEETCKRCAEEAVTKSFKLSKHSKTPRWKVVKDEEVDLFSYDFKTEVDKQSILKVADKMKEELE